MVLKALKKLIPGRTARRLSNVGRNDSCPCKSGEKFKNCCIDKAEKKARAGPRRQAVRSNKG